MIPALAPACVRDVSKISALMRAHVRDAWGNVAAGALSLTTSLAVLVRPVGKVRPLRRFPQQQAFQRTATALV